MAGDGAEDAVSWRTDAGADLTEAMSIANEAPMNDVERFGVGLRFAAFALSAMINALLEIAQAVRDSKEDT